MKIDFLKIKPGFPPPEEGRESFDSFVSSFERRIKEMIPQDLFIAELEPPHFLSYSSYFEKLRETLPLISWNPLDKAPGTLSLAILCQAQYTHGLGRFFTDMMSRNLIPGKQIAITAHRSLNFRFIIYPKECYFITEICIDVENERDLDIITQRLPQVTEEARMTVLATQHARKLVLSKPLTLDEKRMVLLENLSSLVKLPEKEFDHNIFEDTHHFLLKVTKQENPSQISDSFLPLIQETPKNFDPSIFQDILNLMGMFGEAMISKRDIQHLYRSLAYLYLFRKIMNHSLKKNPDEHFVSLKILRTNLKDDDRQIPILAILICVNSGKENELLDIAGLKTAIQSELNYSRVLDDSIFKSKKNHERISSVYLEIIREDEQPFSQEKVKNLKQNLPTVIRNLMRPASTTRSSDLNEEEVMRNILTLNKQLKTPQDIPPVIILFSNETETHMMFTAILVSLQHSDAPHLSFSDKSHIRITSHQTKIAGILNKRHLQKAHILQIEVSKKAATDLYEMRKMILEHLKEAFGPLRDFNTGMIVKQYENLSKLKSLLDESSSELVEKYFYSLAPGNMQSLLSPETLKKHFQMLEEILQLPCNEETFQILEDSTDQELLLMICSPSEGLTDRISEVIDSLTTSSSELTVSTAQVEDHLVFGIILSCPEHKLQKEFSKELREALTEDLVH